MPKIRPIATAAAALSAALWVTGLLAAGPLAAEDPCDVLVVRVELAERSEIAGIAAWTEPWEVSRDGRSLVLGIAAGDWDRLAGFDVWIDFERTQAVCSRRPPTPGQLLGIPGFPCYLTVEEIFARAEQLVVDHPTLASWIDIGDSWEKVTPAGLDGYDLRVLRLTNSEVAGTPVGSGDQEGKPRLFVASTIHARELAPTAIATRFAELLLDRYGLDADVTWLLDEHEIHLLLVANPDGRKHAETGDSWRKNTNESYCGATSSNRGADLNRNFSFEWGNWGGSSPEPCDTTYRGPFAVSEPEVAAIEAYARSIFPDQREPELTAPAPADATGIFIDVHSSGELVLWPWGFTSDAAPNASGLQALGRRLAFWNDYWPEQSIGLYPTDGTTDDFHYGELGVAAYTLEVGTAFFQGCESFESEVLPANLAALLYAAKVVRTPYTTAHGPSLLALASSSGTYLAAGDPLRIDALADDTAFSTANGVEPTQAIAAAEAFLDVPPWREPPPAAVSLGAVDGAFDEAAEEVTGVLDTSGLAEGRHQLFVRGGDASPAWGPVSSLFFWILDPATAGRIEGLVREEGSLLPLEARVDAGISSTTSRPADGAYSLLLPAGTYDVTFSARGYETSVVPSVDAGPGTTTLLDAELVRLPDEASCDGETGSEGWTGQSPWQITTESAHGGTRAWSDSPGGDYGNNVDASLLSPRLNLSAVANVQLAFWHRYHFEATYDYGYVEISTDGGATWQAVASYDGDHLGSWEEVVLDLPELDGALEAQIRFRVDSDNTITEDGWYVDDIVLAGQVNQQSIFADGFESGDTGAWSGVTP